MHEECFGHDGSVFGMKRVFVHEDSVLGMTGVFGMRGMFLA